MIDAATMSRIENNKGNPTLATLEAIADVFRVKVADLLVEGDAKVRYRVRLPTA